MKKLIYLFFLLFGWQNYAQVDSLNILTYKEFIYNVISEHPIAKSAQLKQKVAKAKLLEAKGGLDPYLTSSIDQKDFEGKQYYNLFKIKSPFQHR